MGSRAPAGAAGSDGTAAAERHLLVVGASGVIGAGAVEHFAAIPGWHVTAASRRRPVVAPDRPFRHLELDLADAQACADAIRNLPPVTHMIYAAVAEAPGLVSGWYDEALIEFNGRMFENVLAPVAGGGTLRHLSLLQGTKAYGAHHHQIAVPAREDQPRDDHPNFYWLHEDAAHRHAAAAGFDVTIFRPQVLLGSAPGAAMNPVAPIGAYAALCRALGRPFNYPGAATAFLEMVDTGLLAEAFAWAATTPAAANQTFNVANGDVLVPRHAWPRLGTALGLPVGDDTPASLAAFFDTPEVQAAWAALVARHGLLVASLPELLGQSHHYVDLLLGGRIAEKSVPVLLSTIKIRQAGFAACRDSVQSLLHWLDRMVELRLLPPLRT